MTYKALTRMYLSVVRVWLVTATGLLLEHFSHMCFSIPPVTCFSVSVNPSLVIWVTFHGCLINNSVNCGGYIHWEFTIQHYRQTDQSVLLCLLCCIYHNLISLYNWVLFMFYACWFRFLKVCGCFFVRFCCIFVYFTLDTKDFIFKSGVCKSLKLLRSNWFRELK